VKSFSRIIGVAVATVLGTGYSPLAPGTMGSLVSAAVYILLSLRPGGRTLALALFPLVTALGFAGSAYGYRKWGGDPSRVTVDEFAGCWLACMASPPSWGVAGPAAAFVLFRVFDILKPWPVSRFDRIEGTAGIMLDDLAAGAMAALPLLAWSLFQHGSL